MCPLAKFRWRDAFPLLEEGGKLSCVLKFEAVSDFRDIQTAFKLLLVSNSLARSSFCCS